MVNLKFHFTSGRELRLYRVESMYGSVMRDAVHGDPADRSSSVGLFPWSRAVRALSALVIRTVVASRESDVTPYVAGEGGSLAAALDGALSKEPRWLRECFGVLESGEPVSRRLFTRSNPGRKRLGPVAVALSSRVPRNKILILLNGEVVDSTSELRRMMEALERIWAL
jgi:hypothetical protein